MSAFTRDQKSLMAAQLDQQLSHMDKLIRDIEHIKSVVARHVKALEESLGDK
jgi:hypothetical protein